MPDVSADDEYQKPELKAKMEAHLSDMEMRARALDEGQSIGIGESDYDGPVVDYQEGLGLPKQFARRSSPPPAMSPAELATGGVSEYQQWAQGIADRVRAVNAGQAYEKAAKGEAVDKEWARAMVREFEDVKRRCDKAEALLEATKRAKQENDERFQLEAAAQRERAQALDSELGKVRAELVSERMHAQAAMRARQFRDQEIIDFRAAAKEQLERAEHLVVQRDALRTALEKVREQKRRLMEDKQASILAYEEKLALARTGRSIPEEPK